MGSKDPIYALKREAKRRTKTAGIPHHEALDQIAKETGFTAWSELISKHPNKSQTDLVFSRLCAGELVLLGARPRQGKTVLGIKLAQRACQLGQCAMFFSLECTKEDIERRMEEFDEPKSADSRFFIDTSDEICAAYIAKQLRGKNAQFIVVDYLQLLDQRRVNPALQEQMVELRELAKQTGAIIVLISQIDRTFDFVDDRMPSLSDVRLPNPLDLTLFDQACFLQNGELRFETTELA